MTEKKTVLERLYGLRACMSYISAKQEEIDEAREYYEAYNHAMNSVHYIDIDSGKAKKRYKDVSDAKVKLKSAKKYREDFKKALENNERMSFMNDNKEKDIKKSLIKSSIVTGIAFVFLLCGIISIIAEIKNWPISGVFTGISVYAMLPVGLFMIIASLICVVNNVKELKDKKTESSRLGREKDYNKSNYEKYVAFVEKCETEIKKYEEEQKELLEKYISTANKITEKTMPIYNIMKKTFAGDLLENDWEKTDVIIYYIESGRADTVKEALQLIETKKYGYNFSEVSKEASKHIKKMLENATSEFTDSISGFCREICDKISVIGSEDIVSKTEYSENNDLSADDFVRAFLINKDEKSKNLFADIKKMITESRMHKKDDDVVFKN